MRIRCHVNLAKRLLAGDVTTQTPPPPRFYSSNYTALYIIRPNGTVVMPSDPLKTDGVFHSVVSLPSYIYITSNEPVLVVTFAFLSVKPKAKLKPKQNM